VTEQGTDRIRRFGTGLALGALAGALLRDLGLAGLVSFWGERAWLVPLFGLAGGLVALTRLRAVPAWGAALAFAVWATVCVTPLSRALTEGLVRRDVLKAGDAVLVLSSRLQLDGDPTPQAESRLLGGIELLAQDLAPRLVLTEQLPPMPAYAPLARRLLQRFRIDREVLAVGPIRNTHEEAVAVARLAREHGWRTLLVVTSPTHTRRACAAVEREGIEVTCVPAVETRFDLETLDGAADRLAAFDQALHERLGFWVYRRRRWVE
jgi:uncharacterized SAM-binding protein YcdF (DUF218 family)